MRHASPAETEISRERLPRTAVMENLLPELAPEECTYCDRWFSPSGFPFRARLGEGGKGCALSLTMFFQVSRHWTVQIPIVAAEAEQVERTRRKTWSRGRSEVFVPTGLSWVRKQVEQADTYLLREMVKLFCERLLRTSSARRVNFSSTIGAQPSIPFGALLRWPKPRRGGPTPWAGVR
jgi:hypothetical protein